MSPPVVLSLLGYAENVCQGVMGHMWLDWGHSTHRVIDAYLSPQGVTKGGRLGVVVVASWFLPICFFSLKGYRTTELDGKEVLY